MLAFIPWLRLREPVRLGPFYVFHQGVGDTAPIDVDSKVSADAMGKVLSQYRDSANVPLRAVSVLQFEDRPLGADLDEADRTAIFQFGQHLAVSGLSDRRFIGGYPDRYTAAGHYQVVIQQFAEHYNGNITLTHRRKGGHANVVMGMGDAHFVRPAHLVSQGEPTLNLGLLTALQRLRTLPKTIHEHVDASVTQFLLANSDSPDVPLEAESIATYAALERVTDSDQTLTNIRRKLPAILSEVERSPWTAELRGLLELGAAGAWPVMSAWLQQIYALRGNVAHGKPAHWAPKEWSQQEHLVAGAFVYPLALKCLLSQHELYGLTEEDVAHTLGLEGLLGDRPFYAAQTSPDESEIDVRARSGWVRQFDAVNNAVFRVELRRALRTSVELHDSPPGR